MEVHTQIVLYFSNRWGPNVFIFVVQCMGDLGDWSDCSRSCGGGIRSRRQEGGNFCTNGKIESESCNTGVCPGDPIYTKNVGLTFIHYWLTHWGNPLGNEWFLIYHLALQLTARWACGGIGPIVLRLVASTVWRQEIGLSWSLHSLEAPATFPQHPQRTATETNIALVFLFHNRW